MRHLRSLGAVLLLFAAALILSRAHGTTAKDEGGEKSMPRVVHFELQADDAERATKFYEEVFGWKTARWGGDAQSYWLMTTGENDQPGINGGIMRRNGRMPGTVNTLDVPDVDEYSERVKAGGGKVLMPRFAVAGVGWVAYCEDTEGNMFGIFKADPSAK